MPQGKIALATDGTDVAQHFGRCPAYTLVDIKDGKAENLTMIPNPGHQPGFLPRFLAEKGVKCIISGGMGPRAQNLFEEQGIHTVVGVTGPVAAAIDSYLAGSLAGGDSLCEHGHGHGDGFRDCEDH
ncbi:MAG: dinitrogenase iron-molybdenum cofactor [Firmicutes bacterium]|nr:dinitrogenase iron-molybdenum cofactor [Bacillota bacterium]